MPLKESSAGCNLSCLSAWPACCRLSVAATQSVSSSPGLRAHQVFA